MASNKMTVTIGMTKDIIEVYHQLMQERDNLQTHLDLSAQAIDAVTAERDNLKIELEVSRHLHETTENFTVHERDEARAWARRMKRERDEARREFTLIMADLIQHKYAEFKGVHFTVIDKRESE